MLSQDLMFPAPTYADESVTLALEVAEESSDGVLRVITLVTKLDGRLGLEGECRIRRRESV